eukprot:1997893-Prymnesium_polylepis.1
MRPRTRRLPRPSPPRPSGDRASRLPAPPCAVPSRSSTPAPSTSRSSSSSSAGIGAAAACAPRSTPWARARLRPR